MAKGDKVGYGAPPNAMRWKPGQSGNPKGRRKNSKEFLLDAAGILSEPVKATTPAGRSTYLSGLEAGYLAMCKKALKGDDTALWQAVKVMLDLLPAGEAAETERANELRGVRRKFWMKAGLPAETCPFPE